jgi:hypothetical protein
MQNSTGPRNHQVAPAQISNIQDIELGQQDQQDAPAPLQNSQRSRLSSSNFTKFVSSITCMNMIVGGPVFPGLGIFCNSLYPDASSPSGNEFNQTKFLNYNNGQADNRDDCFRQNYPYAIPFLFAINAGVIAYFVLDKLKERRLLNREAGESQARGEVVFADGGVALEADQVGNQQGSPRSDNLQPNPTQRARSLSLPREGGEEGDPLGRSRSV